VARATIITGNWKMYKTTEQAAEFVESLTSKLEPSQARLFVAAPFTTIASLKEKVAESGLPIVVGAQNMNDASEGAFTGEIAAVMVKEAGAEFVLLGHSERRHIFGEDDAFINKKVLRAMAEGITPVLCVGETLAQREAEETFSVVARQLAEGLQGVTDAQGLILAYEPVWAIGTGKVATPQDAEAVHAHLRKKMAELFGDEVAEQTVIQYGGSVKPENASALMAEKNIDGLLIGGASLDADSFSEIVKQCGQAL